MEGAKLTGWLGKKMIQPKFMGGLGFRDIELFNLALLARQAWRILQKPLTMTARLLKAVYYQACDFLQAPLGSRPSQVWRALIEGRDVLKQGLIRRIGSGKETKVWEDNWIPCSGLLRPVAAKSCNPPIWVHELIDSTSNQWRMDMLHQFFYEMDIEAIKNIPLSSMNQSDFWAWHYEKNGSFSVRSAYRMLILWDRSRRPEGGG